MNQPRLWYLLALLFVGASAIIGCAHHGGNGCPPSGIYGGPAGFGAPGAVPGSGTYIPPGGVPYQQPQGSGLF